jgi:hypothetical protein
LWARRSFQTTATTPRLLTASVGFAWSAGVLLSLTTTGFDHVFPASEEWMTRTL